MRKQEACLRYSSSFTDFPVLSLWFSSAPAVDSKKAKKEAEKKEKEDKKKAKHAAPPRKAAAATAVAAPAVKTCRKFPFMEIF